MDSLKELIMDKDHKIEISPDEMKATINLAPPTDGQMYSTEDIVELLNENEIIQGIKEDVIAQAIENHTFYEDLLVAEGKDAVPGEDGFYTYNFRTEMPVMPKRLPDGSVDYKNMDLFETVKKDQVLATYTPPTNGVFGFNIKGKIIQPKKGKELPMLRGRGFILSEDGKTYTAAVSGKIDLTGMKMEISSLYTVEGNLSLATGNVDFDGDVYITGFVPGGYTVRAGGDITIDGNVEAADLIAGGNILLRAGMQGAGISVIKAGGWVSGKFFESATINANDYISATYLLSCNVSTNDKVIVDGKKGKIIGGTIKAVKGIDVYTAGNVAQVKTVFSVGVNDETLEAYQNICKQIAKTENELAIFKKALDKFHVADNKIKDSYKVMYQKVVQAKLIKEQQLKEFNEKKEEFVLSLSMNEKVRITVKGVVYPGTYIVIDTEKLMVSTEVKDVFFVRRGDKVAVYSNS